MVLVLVDPSYRSVLCAVVCRGALLAMYVRGLTVEVPYQRSSVFLPSVPFIVRSAQSDTSLYFYAIFSVLLANVLISDLP